MLLEPGEQVARVEWLDAPAETLVAVQGRYPGRPASPISPLEEMIEIARRRRPVLEGESPIDDSTPADRSEREVVEQLVGWMSTG